MRTSLGAQGLLRNNNTAVYLWIQLISRLRYANRYLFSGSLAW
jgi:hypothetical protein